MSITGDRLKSLRLSHHLSQAEVADKIGVTRVAYLQYEKGVSRPVRKLKELASLFNVSTDYILGAQVAPHEDTVPTTPPTADFLKLIFADDPETLERINQAAVKINGIDSYDSVSDEAKILIKNALLLAVKEVDKIKESR